MKKILISIVVGLGVVIGGAYYWNWTTLHHVAVVSQPTIAPVDNNEPPQTPAKSVSKANSRVNMLVLGTDNRGTEVARSDTMMLVSVDVDTHKVSVISIPRDTRVNIEGVGLTKITHANAIGEVKGGVHQGTLESAKAVSNLLGVTINYYVKIDFQGFKKAVDAVGGIDVNLPNEVNDEGSKLHLTAGLHHLTGEEALSLSRARYDLPNGDFDRQKDQFYLLSALAHQMLSLSNVVYLPEVLNIVNQELLDTNMSVSEMVALGLDFKGIVNEDMKYFQLPGKGISAHDPLVGANVYYYEPDMDGVQKITQEALAG